MRYLALLAIALLSIRVFAASGPTIFIPQSPLSPAEVAEFKAKLKKNTSLTDAMIEDMLKDETSYHSYRDSDIVAAYPELRGDKKLSACSNRIMFGATEIVYLSGIGKNEVTVKTVHCEGADKGVNCGPVTSEKFYFLDSPEKFFSLENLTLRKARTILETYKASGIDDLPAWFGAGPAVRSIKSLPDGRYRLRFGEYYCGGCITIFNVRLETNGDKSRLVYVGEPDGGCY